MHRSMGLVGASLLLLGFTIAGYTQISATEVDSKLSPNATQPSNSSLPVKPVTGLLSDRAIVFNPTTQKLYAVDARQGSLTVIDGKTHAFSHVKVGAHPVAIAVNKITNRVYVANNGSSSVSVLDGSTNAVIANLNVGKTPYVLAVNEVTNKVYVSNTFSNVLSVIDGETNAIHSLKAGSANEIVIDTKRNEIYLLGYEDDYLTIIDGKTEAVRHLSAGALHLWDVVLDPAINEAYVTRIGSADMVALNENRQTPVVIPTGSMPCALAIDLVRKMAYVVNYADNSVAIIDMAKHLAIAALQVGEHPQAIAVDPEANLVYVANMHSDSISVIDGSRGRVIATLRAGKHPYALAVDEQNDTVYAADFDTQPVTTIDVHELRSQALSRQKH